LSPGQDIEHEEIPGARRPVPRAPSLHEGDVSWDPPPPCGRPTPWPVTATRTISSYSTSWYSTCTQVKSLDLARAPERQHRPANDAEALRTPLLRRISPGLHRRQAPQHARTLASDMPFARCMHNIHWSVISATARTRIASEFQTCRQSIS